MKRALALGIIVTTLATATVALSQSFWAQLGETNGPTQPIRFPHDIHAGKLGMDCLYCHYGAEKSTVANIPPVSTCMGCHKIAAADRPEIQKLTQYWTDGKPVPWVPVYTLPQHVKFNHKRHVRAGLRCQECHGPVETMDRVEPVREINMGFCISCHDERNVSRDCSVCHY